MTVIEANGLRKSFGNTHTMALDGVNLRVEEGRILGLIGPNGAGKTSTLNAILGLTRYQGELRVLGLDPWTQRDRLMRDVCFISDVAVLRRWIQVSQALDYVAGVHPRFDRAKAERFLANTPIRHKSRVRVLSKVCVAAVILPLLTFAITVFTHAAILLTSIAILSARGQSVAVIWAQIPFFQIEAMVLYHLVAIHALWYAPIYSWLLLISAWARRAPIAWAALPLLAIALVEQSTFNSSHFFQMLLYGLGGGPDGAAFSGSALSVDPLFNVTPIRFLLSPSLWIGLSISAAFLGVAVRLRRFQGPSES